MMPRSFYADSGGGAVGSFEATRFSTGYQNKNGVEIHGEKGAISFNFEDMNHLSWFDNTADAKVKGWTKIMVTHAPDHPYAHAWWPDAHIIGYEHTFINQAADMMMALGGGKPTIPLSDFEDAFETQRVLEAVMRQRRRATAGEVGGDQHNRGIGMAWTSLCDLDELTEGTAKRVDIDGFSAGGLSPQRPGFRARQRLPARGARYLRGRRGRWAARSAPITDGISGSPNGQMPGSPGVSTRTYPTRLFTRPDKATVVQADLPMP